MEIFYRPIGISLAMYIAITARSVNHGDYFKLVHVFLQYRSTYGRHHHRRNL